MRFIDRFAGKYGVDSTICGYNINDLVIFADACRKENIKPEEMHEFCVTAQRAFNYGCAEAKRRLQESFEQTITGVEKL